MSEVIPRWEWRSFGRSFPEAEERLSRLTPSGVQESERVYLLTSSGDNLEQWTPVMKSGISAVRD